ncbi:MAG: fibronectin type III domain-containing protein [Verrucomicrobiaceae bacterium]|nr:fibronectin type III domain-containing protein [Verrucomicrobiaceae bacterium]
MEIRFRFREKIADAFWHSAPAPLDAPAIRKIAHGHSGQLILRITRIANTRVYEVRHALVDAEGTPGPWLSGGAHHTNSRALPVGDLVPGALYRFQVRAIGGSTGYSDWSDTVSQRSL